MTSKLALGSLADIYNGRFRGVIPGAVVYKALFQCCCASGLVHRFLVGTESVGGSAFSGIFPLSMKPFKTLK